MPHGSGDRRRGALVAQMGQSLLCRHEAGTAIEVFDHYPANHASKQLDAIVRIAPSLISSTTQRGETLNTLQSASVTELFLERLRINADRLSIDGHPPQSVLDLVHGHEVDHTTVQLILELNRLTLLRYDDASFRLLDTDNAEGTTLPNPVDILS